jgi:hypothetical protein
MKSSFLVFLCFISIFSTDLFAQDSIDTKSSKLDFLHEIDQRKWMVKVPIWVPGFRGDFAYGGITNLPKMMGGKDYDVIDRLEGELGIAFYLTGDIEFRPKKWFFGVDGFAANLASNLKFQNVDKVEFEARIDGTILRGFVGYRVFEKWNKDTHFRAQIYPYLGIRYIDLDVYSDNPEFLDIRPSWVQGVIGVEIPIQYRRWFVTTQLDLGGFGINNYWSSTANITASYRFSRLFALGAGWNFLKFNYDQDFGFKYLNLEMQLAGPVLGVEFHF